MIPEPWRTVFLLFVILFAFGMTKACENEATAKSEDYTTPGVHLELIAASDDGDVRYYRLTDIGNATCYITVGELHGKTVAMECK
jgi:hypothetical protein